MRNFCFFAFFCLLLTATTHAQSPFQIALTDAASPAALTRTGNLHKTSDGGYIQCGTFGDEDYARAFVIKTDVNHAVLWYYHLNMTLSNGFNFQASYGADVAEIAPNKFALLAGLNMFVLSNANVAQNIDYAFIVFEKTASGANIMSSKCYGGDYADVPNMMIRTQDGGFLLSGYSNPEQALNLPTQIATYLVKLDANFNLQWQKRFQNTASNCNTGLFAILPELLRKPVVQTSDGGFVFNLTCDEHNYVAKVDNSGNLLWTKSFNASAGVGNGINDNGGSFLIGGVGSGGAIVSIKELSNGDLVFLGNQVSVIFALLGLVNDGGGIGIALPMGYLFTTDASGNFKAGMAFFHERYNDPNVPIEMSAFDVEQKENGNFLLACGLDLYTSGGNFYHPALVELDIRKPALDEGVVQGKVFEKVLFYAGLAYPYGLNKTIMSSDEGLLTFQGGNSVLYNAPLASMQCVKSCNTLHTFGITMDLTNSELVSSTLSSQNAAVSLSAHAASNQVVCSIVSTHESPLEKHQVIVNNSENAFQIHCADEYWLDAYMQVVDLSGRVVATVKLLEMEQSIQVPELSNSVYLIRLQKEGESGVLKVVKM